MAFSLKSLRRKIDRSLSVTFLDRLTLKERFILAGLFAALLWGAIGTIWEKAHRVRYPAGGPAGLYRELLDALPGEEEPAALRH